jgi:hypothetical protein
LAYPAGRAISFATMLAHIYLTYLAEASAWYLPSLSFLSILVLSMMIKQIMTGEFLLKGRRKGIIDLYRLKVSTYVVASIVFLISLFLLLAAAYQLRLQQEIIENRNRKQIGLWLKEYAASNNDTVFLEPLGYIGFFSQLKMYDWPGLSSPEVVAARRKVKYDDSFAELIEVLQPKWLVLRPAEILQIEREIPGLLTTERYLCVKVFDVSKIIESYSFIPGKKYLLNDRKFLVFIKGR